MAGITLSSLDGYQRIFPELYDAIEESCFSPVRQALFTESGVKPEFLEAVSEYDPDAIGETPKEFRAHLPRIFHNMKQFGYCTHGAKHTLIYALDNSLV